MQRTAGPGIPLINLSASVRQNSLLDNGQINVKRKIRHPSYYFKSIFRFFLTNASVFILVHLCPIVVLPVNVYVFSF